MSQKMKALIKKESKKGIWMDEANIPEPGPNDVQIKILKTAICGTDIHIYNWDEWAQKTIPVPMIIGHEFVGKISKLGSNVQGFKEGDLVSGEGHVVCGHCRNCMAGRRHLCAHTKGVGVNRDGAFAEYLTIPYSNVWFCDKKIPTDILSIFDPFGNAAHTALSFDVLGEDVLITGCGPIGLMAIAIVKHAGARNIVAVDVNPFRLEKAKAMGATASVNPKEKSLTDVMKDLGMVEGFDVGLEMSGSAIALEDMVSHMTHGGKIALLGILPAKTDVSWEKIVFNGLTIKGIYGREMYETWYKMQSMIQTGLDISKVITHRFAIDSYQEAFEIMASGKSGKVILNWDNN